MQVQVDIQFDDLLKIVKNLPEKQLSILKKEIRLDPLKPDTKIQELKDFLLGGPTFSKKQLATVDRTRKSINQWRTK
jgi:hypothetical protein